MLEIVLPSGTLFRDVRYTFSQRSITLSTVKILDFLIKAFSLHPLHVWIGSCREQWLGEVTERLLQDADAWQKVDTHSRTCAEGLQQVLKQTDLILCKLPAG